MNGKGDDKCSVVREVGRHTRNNTTSISAVGVMDAHCPVSSATHCVLLVSTGESSM